MHSRTAHSHCRLKAIHGRLDLIRAGVYFQLRAMMRSMHQHRKYDLAPGRVGALEPVGLKGLRKLVWCELGNLRDAKVERLAERVQNDLLRLVFWQLFWHRDR